MANGNKTLRNAGLRDTAKIIAAASCGGDPSAPKAVGKATAPETLTDRTNGVCSTLAACEELLEAIINRVEGSGASEGCGMPHDSSLSGAVAVADMRANTILANLRQLAGTIGA